MIIRTFVKTTSHTVKFNLSRHTYLRTQKKSGQVYNKATKLVALCQNTTLLLLKTTASRTHIITVNIFSTGKLVRPRILFFQKILFFYFSDQSMNIYKIVKEEKERLCRQRYLILFCLFLIFIDLKWRCPCSYKAEQWCSHMVLTICCGWMFDIWFFCLRVWGVELRAFCSLGGLLGPSNAMYITHSSGSGPIVFQAVGGVVLRAFFSLGRLLGSSKAMYILRYNLVRSIWIFLLFQIMDYVYIIGQLEWLGNNMSFLWREENTTRVCVLLLVDRDTSFYMPNL